MRNMISFTFLLIFFENLSLAYSKNVIIGAEVDSYFCTDCLKFRFLLEGLEYAFANEDDIRVDLLDLEYHIKDDYIVYYLNSFPNRTLFFSNTWKQKKKTIFISGITNEAGELEHSKIYFYQRLMGRFLEER